MAELGESDWRISQRRICYVKNLCSVPVYPSLAEGEIEYLCLPLRWATAIR